MRPHLLQGLMERGSLEFRPEHLKPALSKIGSRVALMLTVDEHVLQQRLWRQLLIHGLLQQRFRLSRPAVQLDGKFSN